MQRGDERWLVVRPPYGVLLRRSSDGEWAINGDVRFAGAHKFNDPEGTLLALWCGEYALFFARQNH